MNGNEFVFAIDKFINKAGANIDRFMREFPQDLAEKVVENTPVLTGNLRANWTAAIGVPDRAFNGVPGDDPMGRIALNLSKAKGGDTIFITNNTEYGPYVEWGTSRMAPRAMVRKTLAQAPAIAAATIRRINR